MTRKRFPLLVGECPNPLKNAAFGIELRIRSDAYDGGCATKKAAAREQQLQNEFTLFSPTVKSTQTTLQFYLHLRPPRFW